jgi:hypothetical protein
VKLQFQNGDRWYGFFFQVIQQPSFIATQTFQFSVAAEHIRRLQDRKLIHPFIQANDVDFKTTD